MDSFEHHLSAPLNLGRSLNGAAVIGTAGSLACGDVIKIGLVIGDDRVIDGHFDVAGCGTMTAAGSAALTLVIEQSLLEAAKVGAQAISTELGGLSPGKFHAADLAADALHKALGAAARNQANIAHNENRTLVAMSGGVDSAVAALLVDRAGRDVVTVTLELWADSDNDSETSCCSAHAVRLARSVAHRMGLPHFTLDLREEFREGVVDPFLADYSNGLTPNPCIRCNGNVRLDEMLLFADRLGAEDLATGHYARHGRDGLLRMAVDPAKDQSYMLCGVDRSTLNRLSFPLGEFTKPQVREIAREGNLPVADKRESQDLCFLAGTGKAAFLQKHAGLANNPGPILDRAGNILGEHQGHHLYTIGQRKGLAIGGEGIKYVLKTDPQTNSVVVGNRADLAINMVAIRGVTLNLPGDEVNSVKLRYRSKAIACELEDQLDIGRHSRVQIKLLESVDGVAPGQIACLLRDDEIAGWGTIGPQPAVATVAI